MQRTVSSNGLRADDVSRELARYRGVPWNATIKAIRHGLRDPIARSTLADANEVRDWRIWADIAAVLIRRARKLYVHDDIGLDLANTVYALDSTTIDLCLSLFAWAHSRSTKAAVKLHTLLDLRGPIPSFIHISDGKMGDALALDLIVPEAGAIYVMDRGYVDFRRLCTLHQAGAFFVTRAKRNMKYHRVYSHTVDKTTGVGADQASRSMGSIPGGTILSICGVFAFAIRKLESGSYF
jgi:Transposase DDE domain